MARGLYAAMPVELAGQFADRFEAILGISATFLWTPSMK
jgi:hypothetical protein